MFFLNFFDKGYETSDFYEEGDVVASFIYDKRIRVDLQAFGNLYMRHRDNIIRTKKELRSTFKNDDELQDELNENWESSNIESGIWFEPVMYVDDKVVHYFNDMEFEAIYLYEEFKTLFKYADTLEYLLSCAESFDIEKGVA